MVPRSLNIRLLNILRFWDILQLISQISPSLPGCDLPSRLLGLCWLVLLFCSSASASGRVCARGVADQSLTGGMEVVIGGGDAGLLVGPELNRLWPRPIACSSG